MFGKGNFVPQFQRGLPPPPPPLASSAPPPPFQLGYSQIPPPTSASSAPPAPLQLGESQLPPPPPASSAPPPPSQLGQLQLPPPPPPPLFPQAPTPSARPSFQQPHSQPLPPTPAAQFGQSRPVTQRPEGVPHVQYQHRPPPPPFQLGHSQQQMPHTAMFNMGQPFMRPSPANYDSAPAITSHTMQAQTYAPSMGTTHDFHTVTVGTLLPNRGPPPPPRPPSQGQVLYRNHPQLPPGIQHVLAPPPPAPSSFIPVSNAPFASLVCQPPNNRCSPPSPPPPQPPPPPPPILPSSPPPLPSSPPPLTTSAVDNLVHVDLKEKYVNSERDRSSKDFPVLVAPITSQVTSDSVLYNGSKDEDSNVDKLNLEVGREEYTHHPARSIKFEDSIHAVDDLTSKKAESPPRPPATDEAASSDMDMEDDKDFPFSEDLSAPSSPVACTYITKGDELGSEKPIAAKTTTSKDTSQMHEDELDVSRVLIKDGSPFRQIKGYASDDSSEDEERIYSGINDVGVSPKNVTVLKDSCGNMFGIYSNISSNDAQEETSHLQTASGAKSPSSTEPDGNNASGKPMSNISAVSSPRKPSPTIHDNKKSDDLVPCHVHKTLDDTKNTLGKFHQLDPFQYHTSVVGTLPQGRDTKQDELVMKVDEFGRMVRDGTSDSDSEGVRYKGRYSRRERSSSRSLSPRKGRRRSDSPWRRKDKRSRSPSWSPKRLKDRSKSPPAQRHSSGFFRRERGAKPQCFDFLKGRCHRGASCRYIHNEFEWSRRKQSGPYDSEDYNMGSTRYKEKYRSTYTTQEKPVKSFDSTVKEVTINQEFQSGEEKFAGINNPDIEISASMAIVDSVNIDGKTDMSSSVSHPHGSKEVDQNNESQETMLQKQQEDTFLTQEAQSHHTTKGDTEQPEVHTLVRGLQNPVSGGLIENPQSEIPYESESRKSLLSQLSSADCPISVPHSNSKEILSLLPNQERSSSSKPGMASSEVCRSDDSSHAKPFSDQASLGQVQPAPISQQFINQVPVHSQSMHRSVFSSHGVPTSGILPSQPPPLDGQTLPCFLQHSWPSAPSDQSQQHSFGNVDAPQKPSWTNIPQPPYFGGSARPMVPHGDFNLGHFPRGGTPIQNSFQTLPFMRPPYDNHQVQAFNSYGSVRLGQSSYPPDSAVTQFASASPMDHRLVHSHRRSESLVPFQQQTFSASKGSTIDGLHDPSKNFPYAQQPVGNLQQSSDGVLPPSISVASTTGPPVTMNPLSGIIDTDITKPSYVATHYNPFASTFENSRPEGMRYTVPGGNFPVTSSGQLPRQLYSWEPSSQLSVNNQKQESKEVPAGKQYDPIFDSIEASSSTRKKSFHTINKGTVAAADIGMYDFENDEFDETADAEVGVVEDGSPVPGVGTEWSPGIPVDFINPVSGEIDVERIPSPGKSKKSKDSRSIKHFRIAVAGFVKEVLKPYWRQGNMSKEAFKTIVKKTVDKVSSTMPSSRMPKTKAKIDQYVESSQRKLTKLVMGYIEKYVKM